MRKKSFLNKSLIVFLVIGSLFFYIYAYIREKEMPPFSYLGLILFVLIPLGISKITKRKIPSLLESFYYVFIFMAYFLGAVLKFYGKVGGFDTLVHNLSGVFTALIAICLWENAKIEKRKTLFFLFILGFSTLLAFGWESLEWVSDAWTGKDGQHVMDTGVTDTMKDIIVAIVGSFLTTFFYVREEKKRKGILYKYKKEVEECYG